MAIAGIILNAPAEACAGLEKILRGRAGILDVQRTPDGADIDGLVVAVEQPSHKIQKELMTLRELPEVDELHLVFADYEDDLDAQGHMECPAHESRRHAAADEGDAPLTAEQAEARAVARAGDRAGAWK